MESTLILIWVIGWLLISLGATIYVGLTYTKKKPHPLDFDSDRQNSPFAIISFYVAFGMGWPFFLALLIIAMPFVGVYYTIQALKED